MSSRGTVGGVLLATAVALGAQACAQVLGLEEAVVIEEAAGGAGVGAGGSVPQCTTPLDCPMDTTCMPATCQASKCGFTAAPEGTVCFAENAGKVCDGKGKCVECTQEVHCPVEWLCDTDANQCVALPCLNGKRDGEESDIDCGGPSCPKCAIAGACQTGDDCASGYCSTKTHKCVETHCDDSTKNADETDVDCGGPSCPKCATDKGCLSGGDCVDGVCGSDPKICLPHTCSDSVKNGSETDVDCGGSCPAGCANGQGCAQPVDCASGFCNATKHVCVATKCEDGLKNGLETDVDCGGGACPLCATGKACSKGADCASTFCNETKHLCVATQCEDGLKNGSETDVDCGGSCPAKCANCKACLVAGDCSGGACIEQLCSAGAGPLATMVSAGGSHTCVRKEDGTLWCWGANWSGQLGDGTTTDRLSPVQVIALGKSATASSAGHCHTCARKNDDTLWCWGSNRLGQLGDGTVGGQDCKGNPCQKSPQQVKVLGAGVVQVAANRDDGCSEVHTCARKADGTLWCWGSNEKGQLGDGTTKGQDCNGWPCKPSPQQVPALGTSVVEVSAGEGHTCARTGSQKLWCWGNNAGGQLGSGTVLPELSPVPVTALGASVVEVSAGYNHTCARKGDGTLWCWGSNGSGQLGDGTTKGQDCGGGCKALPVQVTALGTAVVEVSVGYRHTCARKGDGTLWCWGSNGSGQLGDGTTKGQDCSGWCNALPVQVTALGTAVVEVSAGYNHTCARKQSGTVWCWGKNQLGQLGDGTTIDRPTPVQAHLTCQ